MIIEVAEQRRTAPGQQRRDPALCVMQVVSGLIGEGGAILAMTTTPWASATFEGFRLTATLRWQGVEACCEGEDFLLGLDTHEFTIPRLLVADTATAWVHRMPQPVELTAQIELLVLADYD